MAYDGTIRIDTEIDASGFAEGLSTLQAMADGAVGDIAAKAAEAGAALEGIGAGAEGAGTVLEQVFEGIRQSGDFSEAISGFDMLRQGVEQLAATAGDAGALEESGRLLVQGLLSGVEAGMPRLAGAGDAAAGEFAAATAAAAPGLEGTAAELLAALALGLEGQLPQLRVPAGAVPGEVSGGIEDNLGALSDAAGDMVGVITREMAGQAGQVTEMGRDVVRGIWDGVDSMAGWLAGNFTGFLGNILAGAKDFLGIASPSAVFRDEIGRMLPAGISVGFEAAMPQVAGDINGQLGRFVAEAQALILDARLTSSGTAAQAPAAVVAAGGGNTYYYNQEIHTAEALSPYELTREYENMKAREGWRIP